MGFFSKRKQQKTAIFAMQNNHSFSVDAQGFEFLLFEQEPFFFSKSALSGISNIVYGNYNDSEFYAYKYKEPGFHLLDESNCSEYGVIAVKDSRITIFGHLQLDRFSDTYPLTSDDESDLWGYIQALFPVFYCENGFIYVYCKWGNELKDIHGVIDALKKVINFSLL